MSKHYIPGSYRNEARATEILDDLAKKGYLGRDTYQCGGFETVSYESTMKSPLNGGEYGPPDIEVVDYGFGDWGYRMVNFYDPDAPDAPPEHQRCRPVVYIDDDDTVQGVTFEAWENQT